MSDLLCNAESPGLPLGATEQLSIWKNDLLEECEHLKESVTRIVFSNITEAALERYIQYHQAGMIELADGLQSHLDKVHADSQRREALDFFIFQLFQLLGFFERFFTKYFNNEERLPEAYRRLVVREMSGSIDRLCGSVNERISSEALKGCVLDYLQSFISGILPPNFNFRDLIYLRTFLEELEALFLAADVSNWDAELERKLVYLNFNHLSLLSHLQDRVRAELDQVESAEKYRQLLLGVMIDYKSRKNKPGFSYHPQWPDIKAMVESWVQDEMLIYPPPCALEVSKSKNEEDDKLLLQFSVAHLALITRLFYEEGCFGNASVTDVLKFTARHYRSKRQQQISASSLSKEYYSIGQATAALVRSLFQSMIGRINKSYFPVLSLLAVLVLY